MTGLMSCLTTHSLQLVRLILAVTVAVAHEAFADAVAIEAGELVRLASAPSVLDAVFAVVGQVPLALVRTLALWTRRTCPGD